MNAKNFKDLYDSKKLKEGDTVTFTYRGKTYEGVFTSMDLALGVIKIKVHNDGYYVISMDDITNFNIISSTNNMRR